MRNGHRTLGTKTKASDPTRDRNVKHKGTKDTHVPTALVYTCLSYVPTYLLLLSEAVFILNARRTTWQRSSGSSCVPRHRVRLGRVQEIQSRTALQAKTDNDTRFVPHSPNIRNVRKTGFISVLAGSTTVFYNPRARRARLRLRGRTYGFRFPTRCPRA